MGVTRTYSFSPVTNLDTSFGGDSPDIVALDAGGFAVLVNHGSHIDGDIFDGSGIDIDGWTSTTGTNGALAQLSNGNIVITSLDSDFTTLVTVLDSATGSVIVPSIDFADADQIQMDVAAVGAGFWVASVDEIGAAGGDSDIDIWIRNADGTAAGFFTLDVSLARDVNVSLAALDNGNVAIAWEREVGVETEIWYAVYDGLGGTVLGPTLLDTTGTVNRNASVTAINGGFAIVYEDNGWGTGTIDLTLAAFDSGGVFNYWTNIANDGGGDSSDDANPSVVRLNNGLLAVSYDNNFWPDTDNILLLIDPSTGETLTGTTISAADIEDDQDFSTVAGFGLGRIAVFHTNLTTGNVEGQAVQGVRTSVSDGAGDSITGDDFIDIMNGNGGDDTLDGWTNNDTLDGGDGIDTILGYDGNDILRGGAGADVINGEGDNDVVEGGADGDAMLGGSGIDTLSYANSNAGVTVNLQTGGAAGGHATGDTLGGFENLRGSTFGDTLIGNGGVNNIIGDAGNDTITAGGGADAVSAGAGSDIINYNFGDGIDSIDGGADTDRIVTFGNAGGETLDAHWNGTSFTFFKGGAVTSIEQAVADMGGGTDWLRMFNSAVAVSINLAAGTATGFVSITAIENAWGSAFNDLLVGNAENNILRGEVGDDVIQGGDGDDTITGGDGEDNIAGGNGNDFLYGLANADVISGADGNDTIYYNFGDGIDSIDGGAGTDTIVCLGNSGAETLDVVWNGGSFTSFKGGAVTSIEQATVDMGVGGDLLRYAGSTVGVAVNLGAGTATGFTSITSIENAGGGAFDDSLTGSAVANTLTGNDGNDTLIGLGGNDTLLGGNGVDTLTGGANSDTMTGGAGNDTFVFAAGSGADTITDFDADAAGGQDLLDVSAYGINAGNFNARVVITDLGANTQVTIDGTETIILTGVNGNGANVITIADFIIA